jgi:membrane fusion protein (multidrug efflux system)
MRWLIVAALFCNTLAVMVHAQEQVPVRVAMPQEKGLSEQLVLSGSLTAQQDASLSSRTAGLVAELLVDAGSTVKKGQPQLKLDTALAQHELAQRQAALSAAEVLQTERLRLVTEAKNSPSNNSFHKPN